MTLPLSRERCSSTGILRSVSTVMAVIIGLALLVTLASLFLPSFPLGSSFSGYFYVPDSSGKLKVQILQRTHRESTLDLADPLKVNVSLVSDVGRANKSKRTAGSVGIRSGNSGSTQSVDEINRERSIENPMESIGGSDSGELPVSSSSSNLIFGGKAQENNGTNSTHEVVNVSSQASATSRIYTGDSGCDLYDGEWIHDASGPLYTNSTCPVLTQMQNCRGNGRPDTDYEKWRWRPSGCVLPRFDPHLFLRFMSRKTLAFIGDSVARNQMESLLCILWQVEVPKNRGNRRMQRWYFRSTSATIVRIWSSWLVRHTSESFGPVPDGVDKLHLDSPDAFIDLMPAFDVVVLSSGHWFAKQSAYVLAGELVGWQLWRPVDPTPAATVDSVRAFGISVETVLSSVAAHPNYTGLTIVRSYSPDHYEGGSWNTGGSCTGKTRPLPPDALVPNGFTDAMHGKQADAFHTALRTAPPPSASRLHFMDITRPFSYRHDGHPGPYRTPDPNKVTRRSPDGRPPPQDCLHWCMPGPVDTWNELVLEIIRRHFSSHE